jgi:hypothetical protein
LLKLGMRRKMTREGGGDPHRKHSIDQLFWLGGLGLQFSTN